MALWDVLMTVEIIGIIVFLMALAIIGVWLWRRWESVESPKDLPIAINLITAYASYCEGWMKIVDTKNGYHKIHLKPKGEGHSVPYYKIICHESRVIPKGKRGDKLVFELWPKYPEEVREIPNLDKDVANYMIRKLEKIEGDDYEAEIAQINREDIYRSFSKSRTIKGDIDLSGPLAIIDAVEKRKEERDKKDE